MKTRIRSLSRAVPWTLIAKAILAGLVWLEAPRWFFVLALLLYFIPFFRPDELAAPFLLTLVFAALAPAHWLPALGVAVLFFLILGIKDLVLIRRAEAYQALATILLLLSGLEFFTRVRDLGTPLSAFLLGAIFFFLGRSLMSYYRKGGMIGEAMYSRTRAGLFVSALLVTEWTLGLMFLPLSVGYAAALFFLATAIALELLLDYGKGTLDRITIFSAGSAFLAFLTILLVASSV